MRIKTTPSEIYEEYLEGVGYNTRIGLYENVENNENFFIGKHWEGVNAPDLEKPALPLLSNIVSHFIATIAADDWGIQVSDGTPDGDEISERIVRELEDVFEAEKIKSKNRQLVRNGAVDGDYCVYLWMDKDADTGRLAGGARIKGAIRAEIVDNTNVLFGNPHESDKERQPYIILPIRQYVEDVKEEAKAAGLSEADLARITPDSDVNEYGNKNDSGKLVTTLLKFWRDRKKGTIFATKVTRSVVLAKPRNTEYRLYPIAYAPWEAVKNSYHGAAAATELIPNQIFVNKLYAMAMYYVKRMAFPKIAYDSTKFKNGWNNDLNKPIACVGDPNQAVMKAVVAPDLSNQVFIMIDKIIEHTKEFKGATDVMMGNVRPENASAIVALMRAATIPLELKKQANHQFIEDMIRVMIDIMGADYGLRKYTEVDEETGESREASFDFGSIRSRNLKLKIDVGDSAYWSEVAQAQTMDNLFTHGLIDGESYIEGIPDSFLRNKQKLLEKARKEKRGPLPSPSPMDVGGGSFMNAPPAAGMPGTLPLSPGGDIPLMGGGQGVAMPPVVQ